MQQDNLLPCLCGSTTFDIRDIAGPLHAIVCLSCTAHGPWCTDTVHAGLAWNNDKMALAPVKEQ